MKTKLLPLLLAGVTLVAFTGCRSGGAYLPKNTTKYDYENTENFVLMDRMVQRSVTSPGIQESRTSDGRLQVNVQMRNRETRRIEVQASAEFKDAQGFTIDSTPWKTVILTENEQQSVPFISMSKDAVRYTVRVRQAH